MVVILEQLAHQQEVKRQGVARVVAVVKILVTIFVPTPIDRRTVNRSHQKMDGQKQVHPPRRSKEDIKNDVTTAPKQAGSPGVAKLVKPVPGRVIAQKIGCHIQGAVNQSVKNFGGMPGHGKNVFEKIGGMRVFFRVRKRMVHPVHNGIGLGHEIGRALRCIGQKMESTLPILVHREHLVRSISMVEERLEKNGNEPVGCEKYENGHV